jgi:hypothetical protein
MLTSSGLSIGVADVIAASEQTNAVATGLSAVIEQLNAITQFLKQGFFAAFLVALVTIVLVQLFKDLLLRSLYNKSVVGRWIGEKHPQELSLGTPEIASLLGRAGLPPYPVVAPLPQSPDAREPRLFFGRQAFWLPAGQLMKQIQNLSQQVLDHPASYAVIFPLVASGASKADLELVFFLDRLIALDPKLLGTISASSEDSAFAKDSGLSIAVTAARDHVEAAVERNLDQLQLRLAFGWPRFMRHVCLLVGVILCFLLVGSTTTMLTESHGAIEWMEWFYGVLAFGIVAGYLATILYDGLSIVGSLRGK